VTMVSNVKFYSGKDINLRKSVPFSVLVMIAMGVVALFLVVDNLPELLFTLVVIYAASGYIYSIVTQFQKRRKARVAPPDPPG